MHFDAEIWNFYKPYAKKKKRYIAEYWKKKSSCHQFLF